MDWGVSTATVDTAERPSPGRWHRGDRPLFRLGRGMLVIFAAMPLPGFHADDSHLSPDPVPAAATAAIAAAKVSAMAWAALLDRRRWDDSRDAAGTLFRSQLSKPGWATTIAPVRQPLGSVSSRTVQSVTPAASLPGAPPGDYAIAAFATGFVARANAIETVVMAREDAAGG